MIVEFFVIGGVWFWILCSVAAAVVFAAVESESPWGAFWTLAAFVGLVHLFGDAAWFSALKASPLFFIGWALAYLAVGVCWSFGRLFFWVRAKKRSELKRQGWSENYKATMPEFREVKDRIVTWIAYWPVSMLWTMLRDVLSDLGRKVAEQFKGLYEAIIRKVWGDTPEPEGE